MDAALRAAAATAPPGVAVVRSPRRGDRASQRTAADYSALSADAAEADPPPAAPLLFYKVDASAPAMSAAAAASASAAAASRTSRSTTGPTPPAPRRGDDERDAAAAAAAPRRAASTLTGLTSATRCSSISLGASRARARVAAAARPFARRETSAFARADMAGNPGGAIARGAAVGLRIAKDALPPPEAAETHDPRSRAPSCRV